MVVSFRGRLVNKEMIKQEIEYTVYEDELILKVTPEMVRLLMKEERKDSENATTSNAESFIKNCSIQISEEFKNLLRSIIKNHYG